jgi:DNA-binding transcriptional regulator YiaG
MPRPRDLFPRDESSTRKGKARANQQMLRDWDAVWAALPEVDAQFIRETRKNLDCSRALFARRLCIKERTLENWEQGRAKPNSQAAVLLLLVRHFPDTLERLRRIAIPDPEPARRRKMATSQN